MNPFPRLRRLAALAFAAGIAVGMAAGMAAAPAALAAPPAPSPAVADPTQAQASVPAATYRSAFARYRPLATVTAIPWREANDTVNRIGGWRAYAREAAQPEAAASTPTLPPAKEHRHGH